MNLLLVSQYFWPETFIINALIKKLVTHGNSVVVLTGKPNYPLGEIFPGYKEMGVQAELFDGSIEVFRVPLKSRGHGGAKALFLNYFSFVWSGLRYFPKLVRGRQFDVILVFAISPITAAIPAIPLKWRKKAHLAIWILDLWPESLSATGFLKNRVALKLVGWLVKGIYFFADTLLIQSQAFRMPVMRYGKEEKIVYYPNSIDTGMFDNAESQPLPDELTHILETYFCVVFAGNIGKAQAVQTMVDACVRLRDLMDFKLVVVGSGSMSEWMQLQKESHGLENLFLAGRFPMNMMSDIYARAAGLLVTLKDEEIFSFTVPGKVQAYLAVGKPIIAALNGEGARIVDESKAGLTCRAEDSESLALRVRELHAMSPSERQEMGAKGRAYFLDHYDMEYQAKHLVEILESRISKASASAKVKRSG